jgi:hypothetical protein
MYINLHGDSESSRQKARRFYNKLKEIMNCNFDNYNNIEL